MYYVLCTLYYVRCTRCIPGPLHSICVYVRVQVVRAVLCVLLVYNIALLVQVDYRLHSTRT